MNERSQLGQRWEGKRKGGKKKEIGGRRKLIREKMIEFGLQSTQ